MKLTIRFMKRKTRIQELEQLAQIKDDLTRELSIFMEVIRLRVIYGFVFGTPAKQIKRMKLRQIKKDLEFLVGDPKAKINYKIVGVTDSKKED